MKQKILNKLKKIISQGLFLKNQVRITNKERYNNISISDEAKDFLAQQENGTNLTSLLKSFNALSERVKAEIVKEHSFRQRELTLKLIQKSNCGKKTNKKIISNSGKYGLVIESCKIKEGWHPAKGLVYIYNVGYKNVLGHGEVQTPRFEVLRNYGHFPFLFVENHPNGHDYLVCGEDYQGQTVIELDTVKRRDYLPEEAIFGRGFCWDDYRFNKELQLLIVEGCYWGCQYEYKFYDFSDPMNGWPELKIIANGEESYIDDDFELEVQGNNIIARQISDDGDWLSSRRFKREKNEIIMTEEYASEKEEKRRADSEEVL